MNRIAAAGVVLALAVASAFILRPPGGTAQQYSLPSVAEDITEHSTLVRAMPVSTAAISTGGMALPDFRTIVRGNADSIVKLEVVTKGRSARRQQEQDPMFEFFRRFGVPQPEMSPQQSMGSGFIVSADGKILTNAHVVDNASEISVRLFDQRQFTAKVIGADRNTDVALIQIDAKDLPTVSIGNSDNLEVGEWVLAIGSPFGLDFSATQGIISATGRQLPGERFVPFIQTDAAVNPGNSGGPLLNVRGEVIGINSQIYSRSGGYMGLSFAIPINYAMDIARQLETKGFVERGWLGVGIQNLDPNLSKRFGLDRPTGALVGQVMPGSPAEKAGIQPGDVILGFDGKRVGSSPELTPMVAATPVGRKVPVEVLRDGKRRTIQVTIGKLDEASASTGTPNSSQSPRIDLTVEDLTDEQRRQIGLRSGGVVISSVGQGPAGQAGLRRGDVIIEVNRELVRNAASFDELIRKGGDSLLLYVQRGDQRIFIAVDLKQEP
jgi:serine protease Do